MQMLLLLSHVKVVNDRYGHAFGMSAYLLWMIHLNDDVHRAEPYALPFHAETRHAETHHEHHMLSYSRSRTHIIHENLRLKVRSKPEIRQTVPIWARRANDHAHARTAFCLRQSRKSLRCRPKSLRCRPKRSPSQSCDSVLATLFPPYAGCDLEGN